MKPFKILLIHEAPSIHEAVRTALIGICEIESSFDASAGLSAISKKSYDMTLIGTSLPGIGCLEIIGRIQNSTTPRKPSMIVLSDLVDVELRVQAFELDVEDFITIPFNSEEFRARLSMRMRKSKAVENVYSQSFGPFHIRVSTQKVALQTSSGLVDLDLTSNQFKILYYLLSHQGEVISREHLLKEIWGEDSQVSDRTIDSHIYSIRQQIGDASKLLQSVHRQGYRFVGELGGDKSA